LIAMSSNTLIIANSIKSGTSRLTRNDPTLNETNVKDHPIGINRIDLMRNSTPTIINDTMIDHYTNRTIIGSNLQCILRVATE
jgi:hypothetical protein